jgi:dolichol-phosphate mannosyltransferase
MSDYGPGVMLAGDAVSDGYPMRFTKIGLVGLIIDFILFQALLWTGFSWVTAHVISFIVAMIANGLLYFRSAYAGPSRETQGKPYLAFIVFCLLALALRGGVLADAVDLLGWPPRVAIVPAILAGAIVTYFGNVFVIPAADAAVSRDTRWLAITVFVVAYLLALRLAFLGIANLLPEEAYYWNYAQHLDIGYLDHPPMVAWLIWAGTQLFGDTEFGVRIGAYLTSIATGFFVFQLTRNLFGRLPALISIVLVAALPFYFGSGLMMMPDTPLTTAWAGALYFLERALIGEKHKAWWGLGLCIGLGMLSKYTIALLGPATLVFVLLDPRSRRWLLRPEPYLAVAIAAGLFSPVIYWNATHDWASFAFQSSRRLEDSMNFSLPELIGSAALLLSPLGLVAALAVLWPRRRSFRGSETDLSSARRSLFIKIYTLVPLSVFIAFSLLHQIKLNWTGPVWLAVLPAMSAVIATTADTSKFDNVLRRLWGPTIIILPMIYGLGLHYLVLGFPMVGHLGNIRTLPVAWKEFGNEAGLVERNVEASTGQNVLLVGMDRYFITSELAFYNRQDQDSVSTAVGRGALGGDSLMYDYWFKPADVQGKTVVLYGLNKNEVENGSLGRYFSRLSEIKEQVVTKRGVRAGSFFYRIGYELRSCSSDATSTEGASCQAR